MEALDLLRSTGRTVPVLPEEDPRWQRLRLEPDQGIDLRDRFRGALIGGAIGDAMGRPNEGRATEVARERKILAYQPWHRWTGGPKGTITDDTQMTVRHEGAERRLGCRSRLEAAVLLTR
jgi:hypothetical protein